jgi:hypothetical protein
LDVLDQIVVVGPVIVLRMMSWSLLMGKV